jgi:hypothetical protein
MRKLVFVAITAIVAAACAVDAPVGAPTGVSRTPLAAVDFRDPELGACADIAAPAGSVLAYRTFATGVQVNRWNGTSWTFVAPVADLFADEARHAKVGTHYAGPSWEMTSGSKLTGALDLRCPVGAADIPWLRLKVTSDSGAGVLRGVTHILRVNTVGGVAPATPGSFVGEEARVPYTADYYFYRAP